ncbi:flagellar motor protein MotB [Calditerricola yamamurae]|jgi:Flagellar motor protein
MRRKRRAPEAHENLERWLITYADLITLLMIFFVVMYALSKLDQNKYAVFAQSLQAEFQRSDAIMEAPSASAFLPTSPVDVAPTPLTGEGPDSIPSERKQRLLQRERELQETQAELEKAIRAHGLEGQVSVANTPRGIVLRLNDLVLFELGKADLRPEARPLLDEMARLFARIRGTISVEGHTDNIPIGPRSPFRDNWELSTARALSVVRYFTETKGLDPHKFVAVGYGEYRPLVPNTSDHNRQMNRRVEIVILR